MQQFQSMQQLQMQQFQQTIQSQSHVMEHRTKQSEKLLKKVVKKRKKTHEEVWIDSCRSSEDDHSIVGSE